MKSILLTITVLFSINVSAADIKILSWSRLNSDSNNDSAAEVCFSLKPAPTKPIFAEVTVDISDTSFKDLADRAVSLKPTRLQTNLEYFT